MTSTEPAPPAGADAALTAALRVEYAAIYSYGLVSAYCAPELNNLVTIAIHQHRDRRDRVMALLAERKAEVPAAAAGYQPAEPLNTGTEAAQLAVRVENDTAVAWRIVVEQAEQGSDREFAVNAVSQSAVLAARWKRALGTWPVTRAFPGGQD